MKPLIPNPGTLLRRLFPAFAATALMLPLGSAGVTFDFDTATPPLVPSQNVPFDQTSGGITTHFGAVIGGFSVQTEETTGFTLSLFSGSFLYPNVAGSVLEMQFSQPITNISFPFATADFPPIEIPTPIVLTAYSNTTPASVVGSITTNGAYGADTLPMGVLRYNSRLPFNRVRVVIQSGGGMGFLLDTITVRPAIGVIYTIATSSSPAAGGSTTGGGIYNSGASVTVVATPNPGYAFVNWTQGGSIVSSSASYTFPATANRSLVANFAATLSTVTVTATDATAGEPGSGQGTGAFRFNRTGSTASSLTVNFTRGGTATSGSDYSSIGTSVTFAANSATATVTVNVINDGNVEPDETVVVTLAANAAYTVGSPSTATVTIKDDDVLPCTEVGWVTSIMPGTVRNDVGGWRGLKLRTGASSVEVRKLGRIFLNGNTGNHEVRLVRVSDKAMLGIVVWTPAAGVHNQIKYVALAAPVILAANTEYYLVSQETVGGDSFYNYTTALTTTGVAAIQSAIYSSDGTTWSVPASGTGSLSYVPVGLVYCGGLPPGPPTAVSATDGDQSLPDKVRVSWTAPAGASSYQVFRDGALVGSPVASPYDDTPGDTAVHSYTVKAVNATGASAPSTANTGYAYSPPPSCTEVGWVTSIMPGTVRNDVGGWRGLKLRTGASSVEVRKLGRIFLNGNTGNHEVRLVRVSDKAMLGSVVWTPAGGVHNQIKYVALAAPVILAANTEYYLVSQETAGGDSYYTYTTALTTTGVAAIQSAIYSTDGTTWSVPASGTGSLSYVPVGLVYCGGLPPGPPTAVSATDGDQSLPDKVRVSWTAPAGASSYQVFRDGALVGSPVASPYDDPPGDAAVHSYTVKAVNATGASAPSAANTGYAYCPPTCTEVGWVTSIMPGTVRNDVGGWRGLKLRTGASSVEVRKLGRIFLNGNTGNHEVRLVRVTDKVTVASVVWTPAGGVHNQIKYVALAAPVILAANTGYYLVSQETAGSDSFYNYTTALTTTGVAAIQSAIYSSDGTTWSVPASGTGSLSYVPVGLVYCGGLSPCTEVGWVTSIMPGTVRNDVGGWRGLKLRTGASPVEVRKLGRIFLNGNTSNHEVRLVRVSDKAVAGSVVWTPAGGVHNQIKYVALAAPVILAANTEYYLVSQETAGGDSFYTYTTALTTTGVATIQSAIYSSDGTTWSVPASGTGSLSYVPVGLVYCSSLPAVMAAATANPEYALLDLKEGVALVSTDGSPLYTITTSASPVAGGTAAGDGSFANGASVTLRAIANPGYELVSWTDGGVAVSTESDYTFTADASRALMANFAPRLSIATTWTNTLVISWTASSSGFVLQEKLVVDGSVSWRDTPEPIQMMGEQNQVTISNSRKGLLYRLYHP